MEKNDYSEFRRLFWAARKTHVEERNEAMRDSKEHKAALKYAKEHDLQWGVLLLEASVLENQEKGKDALKVLEKTGSEIPATERGLLLFLQGSALLSQGFLDKAINAYELALKEPKYKAHGVVWNNLGLCLYLEGKYGEAINAYKKAMKGLKLKQLMPLGKVWTNLGNALNSKGKYNEAIKAYRKALKDPNYDTPWNTWYSLAIVNHRKMEKKAAISLLDKIQKDSKAPANIKREAKYFKTLIDANLNEKSLSSQDREMIKSAGTADKESGPEERILEKIQNAEDNAYDQYIKRKNSKRDNAISILRGWSSAVTLLEGTEGLWRGGGYFLKWQGKGIVVDPGFDFLRNFHDAGYHGREIDAVIVTHNHADHNDDLRSIDDLRYELFKRGQAKPYILFLDEDSHTHVKFQIEQPIHHKQIPLSIGRCDPRDSITNPRGLPFTLEYFPVKHSPGVLNAVGFKLYLNDNKKSLSVGFMGDCEFSKDLVDNLSGCDLLIAHISQPEVAELKTPTVRKKNHLGYRGLGELITKAKPKSVIVSEFWAGLADIRIDLVQGLRSLTGLNRILPGGIGLHLALPDMKVECTQCGSKIPFDEVRVSPPATPFGNLSYLCSSCVLG